MRTVQKNKVIPSSVELKAARAVVEKVEKQIEKYENEKQEAMKNLKEIPKGQSTIFWEQQVTFLSQFQKNFKIFQPYIKCNR